MNHTAICITCILCGLLIFRSIETSHAENTEINLAQETPDVVFTHYSHNFGSIVYSGNIDGHGGDDLITSSPYERPAGIGHPGAVYVVNGVNSSGEVPIRDNADLIIYGSNDDDYLAFSIASGDINNDGRNDIILGTSYGDGAGNNLSYCGEVYVIFSETTWQKGDTLDLSETDADLTIYGQYDYDKLGWSLTSGDVNGDTIDDIIMGSYISAGIGGSTRTACGRIDIVYGKEGFEEHEVIDSKYNFLGQMEE